MTLLDRHIYREIIPMFFFGVIAFTSLILGGGVLYQMIRFAIDYDVSFLVVTQIFILKLPQIVAYTLPMSSLFCVLLGFNRLSNDLEITAFRTAGVSFFRLMAPVLLFGFMVSVLTLVLNDTVTPMSNSRFNELEARVKNDVLGNREQESVVWVNKSDGEVKSILYARKMQGPRLWNISYMEMEGGIIKQQTLAEEAEFQRTHWVFKNGRRVNYEKVNNATQPRLYMEFPEMDIILDEGMENIAREKTHSGDYTYRELKERIKLQSKQGTEESALRKMQVDLYSKLSIPFACFAFVFIAAPLGLKPLRASSSVGLGVSVMIIFTYYIAQQVFRVMGQGYLDPLIAAWLPNVLLCIIGFWLVYKASK